MSNKKCENDWTIAGFGTAWRETFDLTIALEWRYDRGEKESNGNESLKDRCEKWNPRRRED